MLKSYYTLINSIPNFKNSMSLETCGTNAPNTIIDNRQYVQTAYILTSELADKSHIVCPHKTKLFPNKKEQSASLPFYILHAKHLVK